MKTRKKTVYGLRLRENDQEEWSEPHWHRTKKERDRAAAFNRIIGGMRVWSFDDKKTVEEIEEIISYE